MDNLKKTFNENKKKIIALILVFILGIVGVQLSDETQSTIVNTIESVVPDLPVDAEIAPEANQGATE